MAGTAPSRRIGIATADTLRDAGGYPTTDGGRTTWGRLYRSDLPGPTGADHAGLRALGVHTVLDLRDHDEHPAEASGSGGAGPTVVRRPLGLRALVDTIPRDGDPLGALYCAAAGRRGPQLAAAVTALSRPGALPALVHCAAGRDRTGLVVALVLSCCGVPDDTVADDFALSATYLAAGFFSHPRPADGDGTDALRGAPPASMLRFLRHVRDNHGDARAFLRRHGVPASALDTLRAALTSAATR